MASERGDRIESKRRKEWTPQCGQVPKRKEKAGKESLPIRSRRELERVTRHNSFSGGSAVFVSLQVWPNLKWKIRLGDEGLLIR